MAPVLAFRWKDLLLRMFLWLLKELLDAFDSDPSTGGGEAAS